MLIIFLILLLPFVIAGFAAYFIGAALQNKLTKAGNKRAKTISTVMYFVSFLIIIVAIYVLIAYNLRFER